MRGAKIAVNIRIENKTRPVWADRWCRKRRNDARIGDCRFKIDSLERMGTSIFIKN
jgi:hypothetical protein